MNPDHHPRLNPVRAYKSFYDTVDSSQLEPTSLSDLHDYEPSLEFDDSELAQTCDGGLAPLPPELLYYSDDLLARSSSDGTIEENFEKELAEPLGSYPEISGVAPYGDSFADFEIKGLVEVAGDDKLGRRVISIYACRLPPTAVLHPDSILRYLIFTLDKYVEQDYIVVYYHCGLTAENRPPLYWLWRAYKAFDRKFKKNLKGLFIVHPTSLIRVALRVVKPFVSAKFFMGHKLTIINYLHELLDYINFRKQSVPEPVLEHDKKLLSKNPMAASKAEDMQQAQASGGADPAQPKKPAFYILNQIGCLLDDVCINKEDPLKEVKIPPIIITCVEYLSDPKNMDTRGLFRRSITAPKLRQMIEDVNDGKEVDFDNDPHMAAVLLKSFFRQLQQPILTEEALNGIMQLPLIDMSPRYGAENSVILKKLPRANYAVLKYVVFFLVKVASRAKYNKMTFTNLAVVFGPNLAWPADRCPDLAAVERVNKYTEYILSNHEQCFST